MRVIALRVLRPTVVSEAIKVFKGPNGGFSIAWNGSALNPETVSWNVHLIQMHYKLYCCLDRNLGFYICIHVNDWLIESPCVPFAILLLPLESLAHTSQALDQTHPA